MLQEKMKALMKDVSICTAERDELIRLAVIALLAGRNLFILGETGQGKSYVINQIRQRITGTRQFTYQMSKHSSADELFGRIDLGSLMPNNPDPGILDSDSEYRELKKQIEGLRKSGDQSDQYYSELNKLNMKVGCVKSALYSLHGNSPRLLTDGRIPDSDIVFLDELFKAGDAVLNSLLTVLNERRYTDEGRDIPIPVISFFAAGNEIPCFADQPVLRPVYDRFEIRYVTDYIQNTDNRLTILRRQTELKSDAPQAVITKKELEKMRNDASHVTVPDEVLSVLDDILCSLRTQQIRISDRRFFSLVKIVQAQAWLEGRKKAEILDLQILEHCLWDVPEDRPVVSNTIQRMCVNPIRKRLDELLSAAVEAYGEFEHTVGDNAQKSIGKFRRELSALYGRIMALECAADDERKMADDSIAEMQRLCDKANQTANYSTVPIHELHEMFTAAAS